MHLVNPKAERTSSVPSNAERTQFWWTVYLPVPTIGFNLLYAFVTVSPGRRELVWVNVATNPTAEWIARQLTEAFPRNGAPHYISRDRDRIYGSIVARRMGATGIRGKLTTPPSSWQTAFAERLTGLIRRECVDDFIVLGEAHLRRILRV